MEGVGVECSTEGSVVTLTIDRGGHMNALTTAIADEMVRCIGKAESNPAAKILVLRSRGKGFSAGFDLKSIAVDDGELLLGTRVLKDHFEPLITALTETRLVVVAAVHGPVAGVAVAVALACDLIVAREDAFFYMPFAQLAAIPDGGGAWFLNRALGPQRAAGLCYLGGKMGAREAAAAGLVWACEEADTFEKAIAAMIERLNAVPRPALEGIKTILRFSDRAGLADQLVLERHIQDQLGRDPAFVERVRQFQSGAGHRPR